MCQSQTDTHDKWRRLAEVPKIFEEITYFMLVVKAGPGNSFVREQ